LFAIVLTAPLWILSWVEGSLTGSESLFSACAELLSLIPGPPGILLRRGFYVQSLESCAWDVSLGFGTRLSHRAARIERCVYTGSNCRIGLAWIEPDVLIGDNVDILSGRRQHRFGHLSQPLKDRGGSFTRIRIGRNVWIGTSVVVMADIGMNSVVGAGSVVVRSIPAGAVAVGNPAVVKRLDHDGRPRATDPEGSAHR
jgi:acetyltransferase-like isoleucine patch superfamily enzyme